MDEKESVIMGFFSRFMDERAEKKRAKLEEQEAMLEAQKAKTRQAQKEQADRKANLTAEMFKVIDELRFNFIPEFCDIEFVQAVVDYNKAEEQFEKAEEQYNADKSADNALAFRKAEADLVKAKDSFNKIILLLLSGEYSVFVVYYLREKGFSEELLSCIEQYDKDVQKEISKELWNDLFLTVGYLGHLKNGNGYSFYWDTVVANHLGLAEK